MRDLRSAAFAVKTRVTAPRRRRQDELDRLQRLNARLEKSVDRLNGAAPRTAKSSAPALPADFDEASKQIIQAVRPYTMTSPDKLFALITAVRHIARTGVPGDLVECGVWRGGSMHAVARTLLAEEITDRELYLFDTFAGMTEPTDKDKSMGGALAADLLAVADKSTHTWAIASLDDVREGVGTLDYPQERFHFVKGPVEETIPDQAPDTIALLRLDTDWYESTRHELEHLYHRLVPGGVLIIDDYGTWQGSKEATDEFLATLESPPLMLRAGRARIGVKPVP